tara:strand:- start:10015 stop:10491 length:477 start_codon:yes stop_codon:yes gene_type:complete
MKISDKLSIAYQDLLVPTGYQQYKLGEVYCDSATGNTYIYTKQIVVVTSQKGWALWIGKNFDVQFDTALFYNQTVGVGLSDILQNQYAWVQIKGTVKAQVIGTGTANQYVWHRLEGDGLFEARDSRVEAMGYLVSDKTTAGTELVDICLFGTLRKTIP